MLSLYSKAFTNGYVWSYMKSVVKRKRKSILQRIVGKVKENSSTHEQDSSVSDVPLDDIRMCMSDMASISTRRNELKKTKHSKTDTIVSFYDND